MAFRADPHGQHVIGEPCRFRPRRSERDVKADLILVGQGLEPAEAVRIRPDRVVDPREVHVDDSPALFEEVGQQNAHLIVAQRVFGRPDELVPMIRRRRLVPMLRLEFVPGIGGHAPSGSNRSRSGHAA